MIKIKQNMYGVSFDINLEGSINILTGDSGSGKSFLCRAIQSYHKFIEDIPCVYIDYNILDLRDDEDFILSVCKNVKLVTLDNADLYLTPELLRKLKEMCETIIVCVKDISGLNIQDACIYKVNYSGNQITTIKTKEI